MSFLALKEDGSGQQAVRVSIEGFSVEFVSDSAMVGTTADGRRRILCLPPMGEGIVFEERVNIPEATVDVTSNRITLTETEDDDISQLFNATAETETELRSTALENTTQLVVESEVGFAAGDVVHLGTEAMLVQATSAGLLHLSQRAYWDTVAQAHYSDDASVGGGFRIVSSSPLRVRGRRVRIFLYGEGDDPQGDGTQVWLGKATSNPQLDSAGTSWSFSADSIAAVLRTKLGAEIESALAPRGIYYHWASPLVISITEIGGAGLVGVIKLCGFFETQAEFLAELQTRLDVLHDSSGADCTYTPTLLGDGTWTISIVIGATTADLAIVVNSPADGIPTTALGIFSMVDVDGDPITSIATGDTVLLSFPPAVDDSGAALSGARLVPRGFYGLPAHNVGTLNLTYSDSTQQTDFPEDRIYLAAPVSNDWTAVQIAWPGGAQTSDTITSTSPASNWIAVRVARDRPGHVYTSSALPSIKTGRTIANGTLADFIQGVIANSPRFANRMSLPAIWQSDLADILDIRAVLDDAAQGRAFLTHRRYTIFSSQDFDKYLSMHLRMLNCYPAIDSDGRLTFRRFEMPNASTAAVWDLSDEVWTDTLATLAPEDQGVYNAVKIKTGYDALADKHTGREFRVIDARAYAEEQELHELEIAPQSIVGAGVVGTDTGFQEITNDEAATIADALLGYFATPYKVVQGISVPWTFFEVRCGDVVQISSEYLPGFDGLRPMTDVVGIVVSRRWQFGDHFGTLDIMVSSQNVAGYAPSAYVGLSAFSNVSGNTWDITITTGRYAPEGYSEDDFFAVGDLVRLTEYDSEAPTEYAGTVASVNASTHVIRVTFTGALTTPGNKRWWLAFQSFSALTTAQRVYCVIAGADGRIGGTDRARTFAP